MESKGILIDPSRAVARITPGRVCAGNVVRCLQRRCSIAGAVVRGKTAGCERYLSCTGAVSA